ncbi:hypothetical protein BCR44DRAFT_1229098 [Catenaria anguillulae PL171]|uniref:Uncharacterized protein n=1 Tax=Catenaria anguillulae PL171 TaxID=765915 RepID=A0A1Y2HDX9_9FUNG|nr:hypothetical protein BCR44DRAFT_1229098 [Catenaria anguillulae PL171]
MIAQGRLLTGLAYLGASPVASLICFVLLFALVSGYATATFRLLSSWIAPWFSPPKHTPTILIQDSHRDQRNRSPARKQHQKRPHRKHSGSGSGFASSASTSLGLPSHAAPPQQQLNDVVQLPHHQDARGKARPRTPSSPPSPPPSDLPPTLSSVTVHVAPSDSTVEPVDSISQQAAKRLNHSDSPNQAHRRTVLTESPTATLHAVPSKSTGKRVSNSATRPGHQEVPSASVPSSFSPMTAAGPRHRRSRSSRSSNASSAHTEQFNPSSAESAEFAKISPPLHKAPGQLTQPPFLSLRNGPTGEEWNCH